MAYCEGVGEIECCSCYGTGSRTCSECGHDVDCYRCDSTGVYQCLKCQGEKMVPTYMAIYTTHIERDKAKVSRYEQETQ